MVFLSKKYAHILQYSHTSTILADHRTLVGFLNSDAHEDISVRWAIQLMALNISFQSMQGSNNTVADGLFGT